MMGTETTRYQNLPQRLFNTRCRVTHMSTTEIKIIVPVRRRKKKVDC